MWLIVAGVAIGVAVLLYADLNPPPEGTAPGDGAAGQPPPPPPTPQGSIGGTLGKRKLPEKTAPGVEWIMGLAALYNAAGVYDFESIKDAGWKTANDTANNMLGAATLAIKGNVFAAVAQALLTTLGAVNLPGRMSREFWTTYNATSAYIEKLGPPPTVVWAMIAAFGRRGGPTPPSAGADTWAPWEGHLIALQCLDVLAALQRQNYILPVQPTMWPPDRLRAAGLSVVNDGARLKDPSRPVRINALLASPYTAMLEFIPGATYAALLRSDGDAATIFAKQLVARSGRADYWHNITAQDVADFVMTLFKDDPRNKPRVDTTPGGIKVIVPTVVSFKERGPTGHLVVSLPESQTYSWLLLDTNPGGGWLNTSYPASNRW